MAWVLHHGSSPPPRAPRHKHRLIPLLRAITHSQANSPPQGVHPAPARSDLQPQSPRGRLHRPSLYPRAAQRISAKALCGHRAQVPAFQVLEELAVPAWAAWPRPWLGRARVRPATSRMCSRRRAETCRRRLVCSRWRVEGRRNRSACRLPTGLRKHERRLGRRRTGYTDTLYRGHSHPLITVVVV